MTKTQDQITMTSEEILARLGLQTKTTPVDYLVPALGIFGAGMLVGAGVALMVAPKAGSELRGDLGRVASRFRNRVNARLDDVTELTRDELYTQAQELNIQGRSEMSKSELLEAVRSAS